MLVTPHLRTYLKQRHGLTDADDLDDYEVEDFFDELGNKFDVDDFTNFHREAMKADRAQKRTFLKSILNEEDEEISHDQQLSQMEAKLKTKLNHLFEDPKMTTGSKLMEMASETRERYTGESTGDSSPSIRVKGINESFSTKRAVLKHAKWETPIHPLRNGSVSPDPVEGLSEWENAKLGSFLKFKAARAGLCSMSEHDNAVLEECFAKDTFVGFINDKFHRTTNVKSLLDDNTSGGENLVPEWFDRSTIQFPLLHSEILPYVDIVDMPRGSTVETVSVGNPTLTWGTAEGTAQNLFNTAALVARISADVTPVAIYMKIGRDLLSDSLPNIGNEISMNVGQRHAAELDRVIPLGVTGSGEIEGIVNATGTIDITPANPTTGAVDINDLLDLMFGIEKQYRVPSFAPRYLMSDQRYKSHRAQATGVTNDERLLHGMSVQSYQLLESPVGIENNMGHNYGIFGAMRKYRLWRRAGFEIGFESGGDTLRRANEILFHGRGRYAGKVVDASAFAVCDGWPTTA